jgi:hypothetical protein
VLCALTAAIVRQIEPETQNAVIFNFLKMMTALFSRAQNRVSPSKKDLTRDVFTITKITTMTPSESGESPLLSRL